MRALVATSLAVTCLLAAPHAARTECLPDDPPGTEDRQPDSGDTVSCSGADADGFARARIDDLSVVVQPGASVARVFLTNAARQRITVRAEGRVQSVTRNAPAIDLFDTSSSALSNAGEIETSVLQTPAVYASGSDLKIESSGVVRTSQSESPAIEITDFGGGALLANIRNSGVVETRGAESHGIEALGARITIDNTGTIRTAGLESPAIELEGAVPGDAEIDVSNGGRIETEGDESDGIFVFADGATVRNGGVIETSGFFSPGVAIEGAGANVMNTGTVRTVSSLAPGIGGLGGNAAFVNAGTIETGGEDSSALEVGLALLGSVVPSDDNELENRRSIRVSGEDAHGLFAVGTGNALRNAAGATIVASGAGSSGIQVGVSAPGLAVDSDGNTLRNAGTITTSGPNGNGMHAAGSSNVLTNELAGRILVTGGAAGMRYTGSSGLATNDGTIEASASGADGISMSGELAAATNAGRIEVTGSGGGSAIEMDGNDALATNQDTGVLVTTADACAGIWMVRGGRIQNFGEVQTFGDDASGLVVGEGQARVTHDGSVATIGSRAHGIEVGRTQPVASGRINVTGPIVTAGAAADGIHSAATNLPVVIGATGGISTSGSAADGVELRGGGNSLDNAGEIQVTGLGAVGVRMETTGAGQLFFNTGTVTSSGEAVVGSAGVESVFNSGTISGGIRLGGGNDFLRISDGTVLAGVADGGSGLADELEAEVDGIETLAGDQFVDFETFRKTGGGLAAVSRLLVVDLALVEEGILAITSGSTLQAALGVTVGSGATLLGTGTVDGDIVLEPGGVIGPGLSAGTLSVSGDARLAGILEIEVGGARPGELDVLAVLGDVDLGAGAIRLSFIDGFVPELGAEFLFLTARSVTGLGTVALEYTGLPGGFDFALDAGPSGLVARTTAVPEPSTLLLVLTAAPWTCAARRATRRRRARV